MAKVLSLNSVSRDALGRFMKKSLPRSPLKPVVMPPDLSDESPPTLFGKNYKTSQIYSMGFEFAFASWLDKKWTQACTFVYCKDFLHDAVWGHLNKKPWSIYSFKYTPGKDPDLDMDHCALFFRNTQFKKKDDEFHAMRGQCQEFLNLCEDAMGLGHTKIYQVEHKESPCWLIVGDKGWQLAPPQLGLYTLLIRLGMSHNLGDTYEQTLERGKSGKIKFAADKGGYAGNNDGGYVKSAWRGVSTIFKHGLNIWHEDIMKNYPPDANEGISFHDAFGPVSYSLERPKKKMPHWYRDEVWAKEKPLKKAAKK